MAFESERSPVFTHLLGQKQNGGGNLSSSQQCFRCQKQRHWARDCPRSTAPKMLEPSSPKPFVGVGGSRYINCLLCPCGAGPCQLRTSGTEKNPNRMFYCCPISSLTNGKKNCGFFKWVDMVRGDETVSVPICYCDAGACRIYIETSGPNAGRKFFVCPIKKGQGACNFSRPLDALAMTKAGDHVNGSSSSPKSTLTHFDGSSPMNSNLVEEGQVMQIESPVVDTPFHPRNRGASTRLLERGKSLLMEFNEQDHTPKEPPRKHCKRLHNGAPKINGFVFDSAVECQEMPHAKSRDPLLEEELQTSALVFDAEICQRQAEFWRQISIAGNTSPLASPSSFSCSSAFPSISMPLRKNGCLSAAIHQNVYFQFQGWWGRLGFPPSRCLMIPAPKPFFCCIFPSLDPIFVPQDVKAFDIEAPAILHKRPLAAQSNRLLLLADSQDADHLGVGLLESLSLESPPEAVQSTVMIRSISEAFKQAALRIQNDLLTVLESMDFHDHISMVREASATFAALDKLSDEDQSFGKRVKEFIDCASSLAEIERHIHSDHSTDELVNRYKRRKTELDDISCVHAGTMAALVASRERLQLCREDASRLRDLLCQIEAELSCFEAENGALESRSAQISKEMGESHQSFEVAFKEAEAALKLHQQREVERDAAEFAFEKARALLLQR